MMMSERTFYGHDLARNKSIWYGARRECRTGEGTPPMKITSHMRLQHSSWSAGTVHARERYGNNKCRNPPRRSWGTVLRLIVASTWNPPLILNSRMIWHEYSWVSSHKVVTALREVAGEDLRGAAGANWSWGGMGNTFVRCSVRLVHLIQQLLEMLLDTLRELSFEQSSAIRGNDLQGSPVENVVTPRHGFRPLRAPKSSFSNTHTDTDFHRDSNCSFFHPVPLPCECFNGVVHLQPKLPYHRKAVEQWQFVRKRSLIQVRRTCPEACAS